MASIPGSFAERRFHSEPPSKPRSEAQRDHDRILYSSAFQRLAGITQVASAEVGHQVHNRLTHSLKVAQVARRLAERLGRDQDSQEVASAASLAHDLGHPPFGHVAEAVLGEMADDWGGFEGNAQTFRILNRLEVRDLRYRGLNLTASTLDGTLKYPWVRKEGPPDEQDKWGAYASERREFDWVRKGSTVHERSVEAHLMDWADDVTYAVHDLEDFYRAGLIPLDRLATQVERDRFFDSFFEDGEIRRRLRRKFQEFSVDELQSAMEFLFEEALADVQAYGGSRPERAWIRAQTSYLIDWFMQAVTLQTGRVLIERARQAEVAVLKEIAWFYIIANPALATIQFGQRRVIRELHERFIEASTDSKSWGLFPVPQRKSLQDSSSDEVRHRVATDLVAGLTEDMVFELHQRLSGVKRGSSLDAASRAAQVGG